MVRNLRILEKTIIAIGALDIGYIAWIVFNSTASEVGLLAALWAGLVSFGLPFPELQFGVVVVFYASIFVCGVSLVLRRKQLAWLNYANLPFRLLLVVPTLYPVFFILAKLGIELGVVLSMAALGTTELGRVVIVFRWRPHAT